MKIFMNGAAMLLYASAVFFHHSLLAADGSAKPKVVITVSPITNMVQNIGVTHDKVT